MRQIQNRGGIFIPKIIVFSTITFFIAFADGIMAYLAPIVVQDAINDTALVGLILSISSFFGLFLDMYVAQRCSSKNYKYFMVRTLIFASFFPLIFIFLPHQFIYFAFAMIVWSVYYDFLGYARYQFIYKFTAPEEHTKSWSILSTFESIAYMIGPGFAIFLMNKFANLPFYAVIFLIAIATFIFVQLSKTSEKTTFKSLTPTPGKNFLKELGIMKILMNRLWVLVTYCFVITFLDVSMWTIGVLYTEELRKTSSLGDWFMVIYGVPALFIGILASKIYKNLGKKRSAYTTGALAGLSLVFMGMGEGIYSILTFVFLMSTFYGISSILLNATFEDYVTRASKAANDIVSLLSFSANLAYSVGPIVLGISAKYLGFGQTFMILGIVVVGTSFLSFVLTPLKVRMPQKEIKAELAQS